MMTRNQIKETFYDLTRFYGSARKIGSRVVRDCLTEIFSVRCPNSISRDTEAFIVTYNNKLNKLEYRIRKNVTNDTCYITQTNYVGSDVLDKEEYIVHFPTDVSLFKSKVKYDARNFYERI